MKWQQLKKDYMTQHSKKKKFCVGAADEMTASMYFGLYVTVKNTGADSIFIGKIEL